MAVAIRGSATAHFYKTFHAWSRLGSVSHQQRRGFTPTSSIREANDAQSSQSSQTIRRARTSQSPGKQHGRHTKEHGPPETLKTLEHKIPEDRFARLQQHPTFLSRVEAELDVKVEPTDTLTDDGRRIVRVTAVGTSAHRYARNLLFRHDIDSTTLDNTVFDTPRAHRAANVSVLLAGLPSEAINLLHDNANELLLRIEQSFSVELNINPEGVRGFKDGTQVVAITGERRNLGPAREFLQSLHLDLDESSQHQEHKVETPLAKSPTPASTSSKLAQTASQTSLQTSPRSKPRSKSQSESQSNPHSVPQASPQPISQSSDPISSQTSPAILKHEYKATMRAVPSSVVVLVTRVPSAQSDIGSLRGMTVSSLCSITLEPEPIISFSIRGPSRTLDCITAGQPFTVNFINAHAKGAAIADIFSRPYDDPSQPFRTVRASDLADVYQDIPHGPAIGGRQICSRFTCELLSGKSLEIGDHTVVFARVVSVWRNSVMREPNYKRTFLGYAQAGYHALHGNTISPAKFEVLAPTQPNDSESISSKISEQDKPSRQRRVRIGNLPLTAQAGDLKQYLNESGVVFKHLSLSFVDGQNPSYCFARFRTEAEAERAIRTLDGASFMGRSLKVSLAIGSRPRQEEKTPGSQVFDEPAFVESASTESTSTESSSTEPGDSDVVDEYWRMALDEDDEADVLEERAADQRALGEADKPIDHPAANVEGDKQEK
jgi:flavin reductase (DIM6/NTAB) family NADH-FMN oxidoreductase RutF